MGRRGLHLAAIAWTTPAARRGRPLAERIAMLRPSLTRRFAHTWRDGMVVEQTIYWDRAAGPRAVGLDPSRISTGAATGGRLN